MPWISWFSRPFERQSGLASACLKAKAGQRLSHDNYFHSVLGLLDVQTRVYDAGRDIHADCRTPA